MLHRCVCVPIKQRVSRAWRGAGSIYRLAGIDAFYTTPPSLLQLILPQRSRLSSWRRRRKKKYGKALKCRFWYTHNLYAILTLFCARLARFNRFNFVSTKCARLWQWDSVKLESIHVIATVTDRHIHTQKGKEFHFFVCVEVVTWIA